MPVYTKSKISDGTFVSKLPLLITCLFGAFLLIACEPSPPCPSKTKLEGELPPTNETALSKVSGKTFDASCVILGAYGTLRHGFHKTWYPGGRVLKSQYTYDGGIKSGDYRLFYSDGTLRESGTFQFGLKHGRYQSYHRNGKLHFEGKFQDGKKSGDFVITSSNETHVQKGPYFLGMKHGKWTSEYVALNGRKITLLSFYHYGRTTINN
mgnify:FL=1